MVLYFSLVTVNCFPCNILKAVNFLFSHLLPCCMHSLSNSLPLCKSHGIRLISLLSSQIARRLNLLWREWGSIAAHGPDVDLRPFPLV